MRQSPCPRCLWSAPRPRHLASERVAPRSHPCVASTTRVTARGHADCGRFVGDGHRGLRQSPRLRCCWSAPRLRLLSRKSRPLGRSLAWPHSPRHGACADAQPQRAGLGSGSASPPPTSRDRCVNGAVGADPLVRPADARRTHDSGGWRTADEDRRVFGDRPTARSRRGGWEAIRIDRRPCASSHRSLSARVPESSARAPVGGVDQEIHPYGSSGTDPRGPRRGGPPGPPLRRR